MATTSFTIYSRYDPDKDKERLERETGQAPETDDPNVTKEPDDDTLWREVASASFLRAQRPPPKFIPATISYDFDRIIGPSTSRQTTRNPSLGKSLSSWYRSLAVVNDSDPSLHQARPSSAPIPTSSAVEEFKESARIATYRAQAKKNKNDWFIQKVLQSAPPSAPSTPPPTLADILAREPPPLPSEPKYHPPVWIEIGPSNRGFTMLQKGGWNEGEALGIGRRQEFMRSQTSTSSTGTTTSLIDKGKHTAPSGVQSGKESRLQDDHTGFNVKPEKDYGDVIDLTLSDDESEEEEIAPKKEFGEASGEEVRFDKTEEVPDTPNGRTALLTPIATVLKLDRLGIGLKAKTEGPYKASVKRVTHHAAALAAHMKAAQEARQRREKFGRGRRGFERQKRSEEERRQNLLTYMNS